MTTKSVRQRKIVKTDKLQKSESSLICVIIAEESINDLPVSTSILAHFCIPVSFLYKKYPSSVPDEFHSVAGQKNSSISLSSQSDIGAYTCTIVMLKGAALRRMVMSLLETGRHPMTVFTMSL